MWTLPSYLTNLTSALAARPGLSGVLVSSAPVKADEAGRKALVFVDVRPTDEEVVTLGAGAHEERYVIEGVIQVIEPGAGEAVAVAARDNAAAILAEVEDQLRTDPYAGLGPSVIKFAAIDAKALRQRVGDGSRIAVIEFDVVVIART